jgi:hypothetical protein
MFIESCEAYEAASGLILDTIPSVGAVSPAKGGVKECEGVSFMYKGLEYNFYDFVELLEFISKVNRKQLKRKGK